MNRSTLYLCMWLSFSDINKQAYFKFDDRAAYAAPHSEWQYLRCVLTDHYKLMSEKSKFADVIFTPDHLHDLVNDGFNIVISDVCYND